MSHLPKLSADMLSFWFADSLNSIEAARARERVWYGSDPDFDDEIRSRFEPTLQNAAAGELNGWKADVHVEANRQALGLGVLTCQPLPLDRRVRVGEAEARCPPVGA